MNSKKNKFRLTWALPSVYLVSLILTTGIAFGAGNFEVLGKVVDKNHNPVWSYPVFAQNISDPEGKSYVALTNSEGRYQMFLPEGSYRMKAVKQPEGVFIPLTIKGRTDPVNVDEMTINTE